MTDSDYQTLARAADDEAALRALAGDSLDDSVAHLDAATLSRLNQARQHALRQAERGRSPWQRYWLPATAAACVALALAVALPLLQSSAVAPPDATVEDAYFSAAEDAELLEDLDLVLWLMAEDHAS